jgi:hypothetical protein
LVSRPATSGFKSGSVIENAPKASQKLSKSEILSKLSKKAQDKDLTQDEREKIVSYSLNPVFTEELSKFLEEKQK